MNELERAAYICFAAVPGVGRQTLKRLRALCSEQRLAWDEVWRRVKQLVALTPAQLVAYEHFCTRFSPASYAEFLLDQRVQVLLPWEPSYPPRLAQIPDRPAVLFCRGQLPDWSMRSVALVGTRGMTPYGRLVTEKLARELVTLDAVIVSGFMIGVDLAAHQAALAAKGQTIGVLGYGFGQFFPSECAEFQAEFLVRGGVFLSEYAPGTPPRKGSFVQRNRIIAGLAESVVVVEAAARSGSLITAQCGLEYNRDVCAVPAAITSPFFQGTQALLNEGARMVSSGQEIVFEGRGVEEKTRTKNFGTSDSDKVLGGLQAAPLSIDQLASALGKSIAEISVILTQLELSRQIVHHGSHWFISTKNQAEAEKM